MVMEMFRIFLYHCQQPVVMSQNSARQRRVDNGYRGSLSLTSYNCMQIYSCLKLQSLMRKNEIPLLKIQVLEKLGGDSISRWEEKADHPTHLSLPNNIL